METAALNEYTGHGLVFKHVTVRQLEDLEVREITCNMFEGDERPGKEKDTVLLMDQRGVGSASFLGGVETSQHAEKQLALVAAFILPHIADNL